MPERISGSCLCGAFRFEVEGPLGEVRLCHCETCRRANGTAFSANSAVSVDRFKVLTDSDTISEYQSSPGAWRAFCKTCGSPVYARVDADPGTVRLRLGTLGPEAQPQVIAHVWVGAKAVWDQICDELPCYEGGANGSLIADR